jgi:23S rRNA (adenine2503-C2)-methyltransferase
MENIKDYTLPALQDWLTAHGEKPYRARQIFQWLYQHRAAEFEQMTSLGKGLRGVLAEHFHPGNLEPVGRAESADGSVKFAFGLADGRQIETVLMPNLTHYTVCVSTQVGCAMGCDFCATAKMGLVRNLSPGEIVQQVVEAGRAIRDDKIVRNVVFMGMGEPLHNYDNLKAALEILQEDHGCGLSARRLTVSTSGLVPAILRYAREGLRANLAVSLNAVDDAVRTRLMPVNRRWNIAALLDACREVPAENRYRITFEYVLMEGLTDDLSAAHELVRLLHGFKCKVNLIPYNAYPGSPYRSPSLAHAQAFQRILLDRGLLATIRISKGQDIQAACGQLIRAGREAPAAVTPPATAAAAG